MKSSAFVKLRLRKSCCQPFCFHHGRCSLKSSL